MQRVRDRHEVAVAAQYQLAMGHPELDRPERTFDGGNVRPSEQPGKEAPQLVLGLER